MAKNYNPAELFECVTRIVAHPYAVYTSHDKARAMAIFLVFADYLGNYTESDNNGGHYVYESDATDFEGFVLELLNDPKLTHGDLNVEELLK